jgi:hypothetical protein
VFLVLCFTGLITPDIGNSLPRFLFSLLFFDRVMTEREADSYFSSQKQLKVIFEQQDIIT